MYVGIGLLTILLIGCIPLVSVFLMGPALAGFYYVVLRDMRDEHVEFGMMFKGFENFVPLMVAGLILSIPGVIVTILQWTVDIARFIGPEVPRRGDFYQSTAQDMVFGGMSMMFVMVIIGLSLFSIVWQIALQFAIPLIMERNLGVADALGLSVRAAAANIGGLIGLILLEIVVGILGFVALCLGLFVAIPVIYAANAFAYRQVFPYIQSAFESAPPPPQAYGGGYGGYGSASGPIGAP
jgi:uncharacterized membrane protein